MIVWSDCIKGDLEEVTAAQKKIKAAASILLEHWRSGKKLDSLPEELRPSDRAAAYQLAKALAELSGDNVIGWKIAATSEAGQRHINVDGPLGGRLLSTRVGAPGTQISLTDNIMRVAEIEFSFAFARPLPSGAREYEQSEVLDAVASLHLSIEIPDSRFNDFTQVGALQLIADTACASWLMIGPSVEVPWRSLDLAKHRVAGILNERKAAEGIGAAALGDPRYALTWLVNEVARYSDGIKVGDIVTTGTCIVPVPIAPGDVFTADYGKLGQMSVRIT
jgi:2-keto-4-pentenoate hydratase